MPDTPEFSGTVAGGDSGEQSATRTRTLIADLISKHRI
jgi:hypothetical protein